MMKCFNRLPVTAIIIGSSLLLATAADAAAASGGVNVLSNSDFESGELFPWKTGSKYTHLQEWTVTDTDSQSGLFSAMAIGDVGLRQDFASPIDASDITELSFWLKTPYAYAELAIVWHVPGGNLLQTGVVGDLDWIFIDATTRLNRNMTDIMAVEFFGYSTNNLASAVTFYDNFKFSVVPEPSTIALFLGAAICALRRPDRNRSFILLAMAEACIGTRETRLVYPVISKWRVRGHPTIQAYEARLSAGSPAALIQP